jgi:osmotically-inducible protein OsmY
MLAVQPTGTEPDPQRPDPQANLHVVAERALRSGPYPALKQLCCDCRGGVLVLRGCLPSYYLKQVAQEVVAHLEGVQGVENQIQVVPGASRSGPS